MPVIPINYLAVLAATVAAIIIGSLWYGPLFGKPWMKMMGINLPKKATPKQRNAMIRSYALMALTSLIMSFVLSHSLVFASAYLGVNGVSAGIQAGFWNWLGFIMPVTLGGVLWENKPWKLWFINTGYYLVTLMVMGVILATM